MTLEKLWLWLWESGPDAAFWGTLAMLLIVGAFAVAAFYGLARATRKARASRA